MTLSPEQVAAFVDGQCDNAEAQRIERAAAVDPNLAGRIAAERELRERLQSHFAPIAKKSVPSDWVAMIRTAAVDESDSGAAVIDLAEARAQRAAVRTGVFQWGPRWVGTAIAASLVLGLFLGLQLRAGGPIEARNGALTARGSLAQALDTQLASSQGDAPYRMVLTFRGSEGTICRAFAGRVASGVACRSNDGWQLRHVLPGISPSTSQYRQAGSDNGELVAIAQDMATGDAFDAGKERAAREQGWR